MTKREPINDYVPGAPHPPATSGGLSVPEGGEHLEKLGEEFREEAEVLSRKAAAADLGLSLSLAAKLKRAGVPRPHLLLRKARRFHVPGLLVVAVGDQETGRAHVNIFGCDGTLSCQHCHQDVTNAKVNDVLGCAVSNGVGRFQLTWKPFIQMAHRRRGGAARQANVVHVGVQVLHDDIAGAGSVWGGLERYNGSAAYANQVLGRWRLLQRQFG